MPDKNYSYYYCNKTTQTSEKHTGVEYLNTEGGNHA